VEHLGIEEGQKHKGGKLERVREVVEEIEHSWIPSIIVGQGEKPKRRPQEEPADGKDMEISGPGCGVVVSDMRAVRQVYEQKQE